MIVGRPALEVLLNGWVLIIILVSIVSIGTMIDRIIYFSRIKLKLNVFLEEIKEKLTKRKINEAIESCQKYNHPVAKFTKDIIEAAGLPRAQIITAMEKAQIREMKEIEAHTGVLSVAAFIAPLLGLLGTVVGIVQAFGALAEKGGGTPTDMMQGIAIALVTTAVGIIVAVPAAIAFGIFSEKADAILQQMRRMGSSIVRILSHIGKIDVSVAEKIRKKMEKKEPFNPSVFSEALIPGINVAMLCIAAYMIFVPNMYQSNFTVSTPALAKAKGKEEDKKETELKLMIYIAKDGTIYINQQKMPPDTGIQNTLMRELLHRSLYRMCIITADPELYHYQVVDIMDRAVQCGATKVCLLRRKT